MRRPTMPSRPPARKIQASASASRSGVRARPPPGRAGSTSAKKSCTSRMCRRRCLRELGILARPRRAPAPRARRAGACSRARRRARGPSPRRRRATSGVASSACSHDARALPPHVVERARDRGRASRRSAGRGSARRCRPRGRSPPSSCRGSSPRRRRGRGVEQCLAPLRPPARRAAVAHAAISATCACSTCRLRPHRARSRRSRRGERDRGADEQRCVEAVDELLRGRERPSARRMLVASARIAPMTAMPSEPPTWRMLFSTPEPTPALSTGTEPIAADGRRRHRDRHAEAAEDQRRQEVPEARVRRPSRDRGGARRRAASCRAPISQREPMRSESLPGDRRDAG